MESSPLSQANFEMSSVASTKYPPIQVDLGIIFDDEEVYACFPLARFNLDSNDSIESVNSSCDCVSLSLLDYLDSKTDTKRALRIDVSPWVDPGDGTPLNLGVVCKILLSDGDSREFTICFLQTSRHPDSRSSLEREAEISMSKNWLVCIVILVTIVFGLACSRLAQSHKALGESIIVDDLKIGGTISLNGKQVIEKRIRNRGASLVKVTGLLVSCSCMGAMNLPLEIAPGEEQCVEIGIGANPKKYSVGSQLTQEYSVLMEVSGKVHAIPGKLNMRVVE